MLPLRLTAQISPEWANVRDIRMQVSHALVAQSQDIRDATCMVVSELLENAVKYGGSMPESRRLDFALAVEDDKIEVRVTSGATSGEHVQRLTQRVHEVNETERSGVLYLQRFHDLLNDPNQSGGLGIYRICVEGGFKLSVSQEGDVLAVVARRSMV